MSGLSDKAASQPEVASADTPQEARLTAAHPAMCVDEPTEPHVDPETGACQCLGPCCSVEKVCVCPDCCAFCGDDHA